jgi:polar amino acid transport system substrate-binding protein
MLTVFALLCVTLAAGPVLAKEPADSIAVSFIESMPDLEAARSVLAEAYGRLGVEVSFKGYEAAAALEASRSGEVDAELNRIGGIDRDFPELVQIPIPVNMLQGAAFSRDYRFPIRSWSSLKPYKIGIVRGILFATEGTRGMDVSEAEDHHELIRWVDEGRVDVAVMSRFSGYAAIRSGGYDGVHELDGLLETLLLYHYLNVNRADLAPRLTPVLKQMLLDGTTRRILDDAAADQKAHAP